MTNKGIHTPDNVHSTELNFEQKKTFNSKREILTSFEFAKFVLEKLALKYGRDVNQIPGLSKIFDDKLFLFLDEFITTILKLPVEVFDMDRRYPTRISCNDLIDYFNMIITQVNLKRTSKITLEELYTLKEFLKDKYLSAKDVENILKHSKFETQYSHVNERIHKFLKMGLLEQVNPTEGRIMFKLDSRSQYYKLTPGGLLFALKEIEEDDLGSPFITGSRVGSIIFETYQDDILMQLFMFDQVDKELLFKITDPSIKWSFIQYLRDVSQLIYKELELFSIFQRERVYTRSRSRSEIKWIRNLENRKSDWNKFFNNLIWQIFPSGELSSMLPIPSKFIINPIILKDYCSFCYNDNKYSIQMDMKKEGAKLLINDKECTGLYDGKIGAKVFANYCKFKVETKPHCFILHPLGTYSNMYQTDLAVSISDSLKFLRDQLGYSIISLFNKDFLTGCKQSSNPASVIYIAELRKLAKDAKVKLMVEQRYQMVSANYTMFTKL